MAYLKIVRHTQFMEWHQHNPEGSARMLNNANSFIYRNQFEEGVGMPDMPEGWKSVPTLAFASYITFRDAVIPAGIRAVAYDNEKWAQTPVAEQNKPRAYTRYFRDLAHKRGLTFISVPGRPFNPPAHAPYCDILNFQLQRLAGDTANYAATCKNWTTKALWLDADVKITTEVSTTQDTWGTPEKIWAAVKATKSTVQGFWFMLASGADRQDENFTTMDGLVGKL
jgi:hypothetical protein